ncbi:MAG: 4-amino-4-deoxy-L-arabinose-phospho-UDP flippase [Azonexus sp.]|uniref:4-amino-4-deoxy-L-arabinose-phosphoundecaprenol flippase subunit ArnF n=1 Tax=Azonexus sp. TaxID=1872668 RepID=UPI00281C1480|nr:4-amino-4-deoxy-L-arabinose-phosphoundecaprenol flippase subunit ArnF [Azonexus sp.]MDR0775159.1 4-amino-4-deoxy-L-arabinose-phospho-UDP flippase [Azonexus sp.]
MPRVHRLLRPGLAHAVASVLLVSIAQLALKRAATDLHDIIATLSLATLLAHGTAVIALLLGLACYAASMLLWLRALHELPLSVAYPLLGLSYPLVYLGALLLPGFEDAPSTMRLLGILLTLLGIALLAPRPVR